MNPLSALIDRLARSMSEVQAHNWNTSLPATSDTDLLAKFATAGELRSAVDTLLVSLSGEIASRSSHEAGPSGLSKRAGYNSPASFIAETAGINTAEAAKVVRVAQATQQRMSLCGEVLPARYEHVQQSLQTGTLSTEQSDIITRALDAAREVADPVQFELVEATLVEIAPTLTQGDLRKTCEHAKLMLDPDGAEPTEAAQRAQRLLRFSRTPNGMSQLVWLMPAEQAALVKAGIDTIARQIGRGNGNTTVSDQLDSADHGQAGEQFADGQPREQLMPESIDPHRHEISRFDMQGNPLNGAAKQLSQLRADAAFAIFEHTATCQQRKPGMPAYHAVVRVDLDALRGSLTASGHLPTSNHAAKRANAANGTSTSTSTAIDVLADPGRTASLDGVEGSISAALARRLASAAGIIPAVMGSRDVPLNLGRTERQFSPAQRAALIERDSGCAWPGCDMNPAWSDAHHIDWWASGNGPTDLSNGIMLCSSHHHRVHDTGWRIEFAPPAHDPEAQHVPWFIPPPDWSAIDPRGRERIQGGNPIRTLQHALAS